MSKPKRPLTMLERHFIKTLKPCTHRTCSAGACDCDDCMDWMEAHGSKFDRYPGQCKRCMGTSFALKLRPAPLDENGGPVKPLNKEVDEAGKPARVIGASQPRATKRSPPQKPMRGSAPRDDSVQAWMENKAREKEEEKKRNQQNQNQGGK